MPTSKKKDATSLKRKELSLQALPQSLVEWTTRIQHGDHECASLINITPKSASKAKDEQFYMFKALYLKAKSRGRLEKDLHRLINKRDLFKNASDVLAASADWSAYKISFNQPTASIGLFDMVRLYQLRCSDGLMDNDPARHMSCEATKPSEAKKPSDIPPEQTDANPTRTSARRLSTGSSMSTVTTDAITDNMRVEDEEIVNFALVLFMNALVSVALPGQIQGDWWPCRSAFQVQKYGRKVYEARVDGIFRVDGASSLQIPQQLERTLEHLGIKSGSPAVTAQLPSGQGGKSSAHSTLKQPLVFRSRGRTPHRTPKKKAKKAKKAKKDEEARDENLSEATFEHTHNITIIAEVKPMARASSTKEFRKQIQIQESAQMVAWIAQVPKLLGQVPDNEGKYRRLLLSQDQREIYLTIATYTDKYIHYIMHATDSPAFDKSALGLDCFLSMQPYGPFCVDRFEDMEQLAVVLIALSHQNYVI